VDGANYLLILNEAYNLKGDFTTCRRIIIQRFLLGHKDAELTLQCVFTWGMRKGMVIKPFSPKQEEKKYGGNPSIEALTLHLCECKGRHYNSLLRKCELCTDPWTG